ncbi:hypothetical protein A8C56_13275 [Niabella ginsenosidivorans]|uniref:Uncharacterized protein n=1 Tax=Niabella ginsenosidivorans TaxID=1176587 RepID=A0A1A9I576_9BACT|nr:hypothetical protein [Niabella ginsenosidivorans]ANH81821.1 hypothetical protein A8C56_13275 [Niabella ginsenosidivorans]
MLQNRVDPLGRLIFTEARGHWMGNRGRIHNEKKQITHRFRLKAWITCLLEFRGRKRVVMAPNRYTELFFLDEATAFAAGHRPCFECRRKAFNHFKACWLKGNPEYGFTEKTPVKEIDAVLHKERINKKGEKVTYEEAFSRLPDGVFVLYQSEPYLVANHLLHQWTPFGYKKTIAQPPLKNVTVLTPRSLVNTFRAGYQPQWEEVQ